MRTLRPHLLYLLLGLGLGSCQKNVSTGTGTGTMPAPVGTTFVNPLLATGPDPWVVQQNGYYYFLSTTGGDVRILKTANMSDLRAAPGTSIWRPGPATSPSARYDVWAPELHYLDGKWYVYFTAGPGNCCGGQRLWVLENASPDPTQGTWTEKGQLAVPGQDLWAIDGTILAQNGQRYLVWSGQEAGSGQQNIYIARLSNPWTLIGPRVQLSHPQYAWEQHGTPSVNEGPEILQHGGKTFLTYSASHCSTDDYALGMLTVSASADPMDASAWTKSPTPVLVKNPAGGVYGPGHNSFFKSKDGREDWIIYHANNQAGQGCGNARNPRMQKFTWNADGSPNFGPAVGINVALPKPAGE